MSQLLETIKLENGRLANLKYHNARFNKARKELFSLPGEDLAELISVPSACKNGIFRCRALYQQEIEKVEFLPHQPRDIKSLKVIHNNSIEYPYKYADRTSLQELYNQRGDADEVIIIKNGLVTDCFIGNLVFFDGNKWLTPDQPLLCGTQRQNLLDNGKILEARITENDLFKFSLTGIINVFYGLENMSQIKKEQISY
jgi:4-amino-4-deoxychorismate lyase